MIDETLFAKINDALDERSAWELKQLDWYRLRYTGYGRPVLPYPNAPDMHYPLVDGEIEKLKPLYIQQIYGQETLANFIDMEGNEPVAEEENRFDKELKQSSNFETSSHTFVDKMLNYGVTVVKTIWDDARKRLKFVPIDAIKIVVPYGTPSLADAEWIVHIIRMSERQYRRNAKFTQDEDLIKRIKGRGTDAQGHGDQKQQESDAREGITGSNNNDTIVLWEVYHKPNPTDKTWTVSTVSPLDKTANIAKDFPLPYNAGVFAEGEHPFTEFTYEQGTEGFYSARGVAEILEAFELDLCKMWNYKLQFLDFNGQPTFYIDSPTANMMNFTNAPGSTRPFGIKRDDPLSAPVDISQEMAMTRALAEDRIAIPDLGNPVHMEGRPDTQGKVTATQIRAIVGASNQSNDLRAKLFKGQLASLYNKAYSILCQYRNYEPRKCLIVPSGSADVWNKEMRTQKMLALFQLLSGRPNVDQDELVKILLEQDSPELVKRLFRDSGEHTQDEQQKEAAAITLMLIGFAPEVRPDEDAAVRMQTLAQFVERRLQTGEQISPEFARLVLIRAAQHEQILKAQKNPMLDQLNAQYAPIAAVLGQIAASQAPVGAPAPAMPGMAPGMPGMTPQAPAGGDRKPVSESISIKLSDLTPDERAQALALAGIRATPGAVSVAPSPKPTAKP